MTFRPVFLLFFFSILTARCLQGSGGQVQSRAIGMWQEFLALVMLRRPSSPLETLFY